MKITEIILTRRSVLFGMGAGLTVIASAESRLQRAETATPEQAVAPQTVNVPARKKVPAGLL